MFEGSRTFRLVFVFKWGMIEQELDFIRRRLSILYSSRDFFWLLSIHAFNFFRNSICPKALGSLPFLRCTKCTCY